MSTRSSVRSIVLRSALGLLLFGSLDCSLLAKSTLGAGIGAKCSTDDECQAGFCDQAQKTCSTKCVSNLECPTGAACVAGNCRIGCNDDRNCNSGSLCIGNVCIPNGCRDDAACASTPGTICKKNQCQAGCNKDADCVSGKFCDTPTNTCLAGCTTDDQCPAGNYCDAASRVCKSGCKSNLGCEPNQYCALSDATGACQPALRVYAILPGPTKGDATDGWSLSHVLGLDEASKLAPSLRYASSRTDQTPYLLKDDVRSADDVDTAIKQALKQSPDVVVTASPVANDVARSYADANPGVKFLAMRTIPDSGSIKANVGSYSAVTAQWWWAVGKLAAQTADKDNKCVGMILPVASPQYVRETNAFALGAKSANPAVKVVIRWLGNTRDPSSSKNYSYKAATYAYDSGPSALYREELLTAQLADLGCKVIAHRTETSRSVTFVDNNSKAIDDARTPGDYLVQSLAADVASECSGGASADKSLWYKSCYGVPLWQWRDTYANVFGLIEAKTWVGGTFTLPFSVGPASLMQFEQNARVGRDIVTAALNDASAKLAPEGVFQPTATYLSSGYSFNGQRSLDDPAYMPSPSRQAISPGTPFGAKELDQMCWFVDNVYELPDYKTVTYASLKPALVPYGPPLDSVGSTTMAPAECNSAANAGTADCKKYGDVINFLRVESSPALDPHNVMNCGGVR